MSLVFSSGDEQSREGSNRDAVNMMTSLESLGFKVEVFENLKSREFYQLLYNLSEYNLKFNHIIPHNNGSPAY